jgi:hypothetical protein
MAQYVALMTQDDTGIGFTVPDLGGFVAHAETQNFDIAHEIAVKVLADYAATLCDMGEALPSPRAIDALRADPALAEDFAQASAIVMLPVLAPLGRMKRVGISLDENTLDLIDRAARRRGITRSAFVGEAARRLAQD